MNSACGKVLGDFARSVLHHHRAVADPDHAIFGDEHGAEQDPGIRPDANRSTHHRGGRHYNDVLLGDEGGQVEHLGHRLAD